jgi:hypothetical protein
MCEVVTKVIMGGRRYLIPLLPEYESPRLQEMQKCILYMVEHLQRDFPGNGRISLTWDDDKEESPLSMESDDIHIHEVIKSWNRLEPFLPCLTELRSKI